MRGSIPQNVPGKRKVSVVHLHMQSLQAIDVTTDERFAQRWVTRRIKRSNVQDFKFTSHLSRLDSILQRESGHLTINVDHALAES